MLTANCAPLVGRTILVTRAAHQAQSTLDAVVQRGGHALSLPCLEMVYHASETDRALQALAEASDAALLITSINGINSLLAHSSVDGLRQLIGEQRQVVAVGSHTAQALRQLGVNGVVVPQPFSQQGVAAWWNQHGWPNRLVFIRAAQGRDDLLPLLDAHGCVMQLFACYGSRVPSQAVPMATMQALQEGRVDALLLGSSATARGLIARVGSELAARPIAVAISQRVADEAVKLALRVQVVAAQASFDGMLDQLGDYFGGAA